MRKILSPFLGSVRKSSHTFLFYPAKDRSTVKTLGTPDYNMCSKKNRHLRLLHQSPPTLRQTLQRRDFRAESVLEAFLIQDGSLPRCLLDRCDYNTMFRKAQ
jgi:hypothetical protein